jgi:hypothetical protein
MAAGTVVGVHGGQRAARSPRRVAVPTGVLARHAGHGHHGEEERRGPHGGHDHRKALHLHHFPRPPPSARPRCATMPSQSSYVATQIVHTCNGYEHKPGNVIGPEIETLVFTLPYSANR